MANLISSNDYGNKYTAVGHKKEIKTKSITDFDGTYEFGFKEDYFDDIAYTCDLWYSSDHQHHVHFDGFIPDKTFVNKCVDRKICIWTATVEGIYFTDDVKKVDELWYKWDN
ncbi:hypothetical protein ACFE04_030734 [Oxalis oulophora]